MHTCYHCGKLIKGKKTKMILSVPSNLAKSLGDYDKAFHLKCYETAEREAELLITNREGE